MIIEGVLVFEKERPRENHTRLWLFPVVVQAIPWASLVLAESQRREISPLSEKGRSVISFGRSMGKKAISPVLRVRKTNSPMAWAS